MRVSLGDVRTTYHGFTALIDLYHRIRASDDDHVEIDLAHCDWMDANMCAPLGAVLCAENRDVTLAHMREGLTEVLQKNGFFENLGFDLPKTMDVYGTTLECRRFGVAESHSFRSYVADQFRGKGLPQMTDALRREFRRSLAELFENAKEHSESQGGVFACGQWFPRNDRLDFCVVDLGIGFRKRIERDLDIKTTSARAIRWAVAGNTTRDPGRGRPGGLGLKLISEFVNLNGGSIQIVSDRGYWRFHRGHATVSRFDQPFPGTVVNIEIDTADTHAYCLDSEVDPDGIF